MSNVPPPFHPGEAPRPKKNSTPIIIILVVVAVFGICVLGIVGVSAVFFGLGKAVGPTIGCAVSFEIARDAVMSYAKEHDDTLPNAATWQEDVTPFLSQDVKELKRVPFDIETIQPGKLWGCNVGKDKRTGMAYNDELSGKKISDIEDPYSVILIFEVDSPAMNAHRTFVRRGKEDSPEIFGEKRGWIAVPLMGDVDLNESGSSRARLNIKVDPPENSTRTKSGD